MARPRVSIRTILSGGGGGSSPLSSKGDLFAYGTSDARLPVGANGQVLAAASTEALGLKWRDVNRPLGASFENGGDVLEADTEVGAIQLSEACEITGLTLLADAIGDATVSILRGTYAGYPTMTEIHPTRPALIGAAKLIDTSLTGWTTTIAAGDLIAIAVKSASGIRRLGVTLHTRMI